MALFGRKKKKPAGDPRKIIVEPFSTPTSGVAGRLAAAMLAALAEPGVDEHDLKQSRKAMAEAGRGALREMGLHTANDKAAVDITAHQASLALASANPAVSDMAQVTRLCQSFLSTNLTRIHGQTVYAMDWEDGRKVAVLDHNAHPTHHTLNGKVCPLCEVSPMGYLDPSQVGSASHTARCLSPECGEEMTYRARQA